MELDPNQFDELLATFLHAWPLRRVAAMTIEQYADLSDKDAFCYWLEYTTSLLGAIGAIPLSKFELWKIKNDIEFKGRFRKDATYAWKASRGNTAAEAFGTIGTDIVRIIQLAGEEEWDQIEQIPFHAISKWKIAVLYGGKKLLPVYSKRALLPIAKGLGREFSPGATFMQLQEYILSHRLPSDSMEVFAARVYHDYGQKIKKRNYYIIGSMYGNGNGHANIPKIDTFISNQCVAIGYLDWVDFTDVIEKDNAVIDALVEEHWVYEKPVIQKIRRYFRLLAKIKEGDIIAVKSQGAYNRLTIIAYAEVVKRNGSVYFHDDTLLGHHIHVNFLDAGFSKYIGLTYAETIHQLTLEKHVEDFTAVFGWYANTSDNGEEADEVEEEEPEESGGDDDDDGYNEKSTIPFQRGSQPPVTVQLVHSRIQNKFIRYLTSQYPDDRVTGEKNRIDARRETRTQVFIYEIKPHESVYYCIREAIGQLLDYTHNERSPKEKVIVIVGPNEPQPEDTAYLHFIRSWLQLEMVYMAFDDAVPHATEY